MDPPRRPPPALMEELVEDILLRLPPDDPASLVRAALVCKGWRRLVSGASFRRRFRELHRTPPLLGFLFTSVGGNTRFKPTSSFRFRLPHPIVAPSWRAVDARHGRILFYDADPKARAYTGNSLVVWNPIDGEVRRLPRTPLFMFKWSAALLCAAAGGGDHLDCDAFRVAVVVTQYGFASACVYSSEQHAWSPVISVQLLDVLVTRGCSAVVGNAIYFMCEQRKSPRILEYDLGKKELSVISLPPGCKERGIVLMTAKDGGLGFSMVKQSKLYIWSREARPHGDAIWTQQRVIELNKLLSLSPLLLCPPFVAAVADDVGVVFIKTVVGIFTIDLKSSQVRMLFQGYKHYGVQDIIPYTSFYTPALGVAFKDEA
ncbi:hypothetical protein ACP70R_015134 [Stipagrostis hirtigluma subsp. patula]